MSKIIVLALVFIAFANSSEIRNLLSVTNHDLTSSATAPPIYFGTADKWMVYNNQPDSVYVDVDFSELGKTKRPYVSTNLRCKSHCWKTIGGTSVYDLDNDSFRVYVHSIDWDINPTNAATH